MLSVSALLLLTGILLLFVAIYLHTVSRAEKLRKDLLRLKYALVKVAAGEPILPAQNFLTKEARDVLQNLSLLQNQKITLERERTDYRETLDMGSKIVSAAFEPKTVAEEVCTSLLKQLAPSAQACAIAVKNKKNLFETITCHGLPFTRVEQSLNCCFDSALGAVSNRITAHYFLPNDGTEFNFTSLGIGLALITPLYNQAGLCGAIWIGFDEQQVDSLSAAKRNHIKAIADYAAASFYAAFRAEERNEANIKERDFLIGISHDLRAPGNSALYALRDLLSGSLGEISPEQFSHLTLIEQCLEGQIDILGDVLDFARLKRGLILSRKQQVNIKSAVRQVLSTFLPITKQKGIDLVDLCSEDIKIDVDPQHFRRMLTNLISNAVKYTESGRIEIRSIEADAHAEILVIDTGIGVPASEQDNLFAEFSRMTNSASVQGVGLGLALTKALCEINSGYIIYRKNTDEGSTFGLGLPLSVANMEKSKQITNKDSALILDDDPATCRTNLRFLEEVCGTIHAANSLNNGLDIFRKHRPAIVIADLFVGDEIVTPLLKEASETSTKLILLTGSSDTPLLKELEARYKLTTLIKPASREEILSATL